MPGMTEKLDPDTPVLVPINPSSNRTVAFHRPDCHYTEGKPTRRLRLGEVRHRPYPPCSKCKPDTPQASE